MKYKKVLNLAIQFEKLVKIADLHSNMAKRIMFSLLNHLTPQGESASRMYLTKGVTDYTALKQMIPGAKELIEYGTKACLEEASYAKEGMLIPHENPEGIAVFKEAKSHYEQKNINETLKLLYKLFSEFKWERQMGGAAWAKISATLLEIYKAIVAAEQAKKNYEYEKEAEELMNMVTYVNVLDGLAHNTGTLMEKMLQIENTKTTGDEYADISEKFQQANRLMDSKELKDPDDVLQEIMPSLEKSDAPLTMKDWIHAARQKRHDYKGTVEQRNDQVEKIQLKKRLLQSFHQHSLEESKNLIRSWANIADNVLVNKITSNKENFVLLNNLAKNVLKLKQLTPDLKNSISEKKQSALILTGNGLTNEQFVEQLTTELGYHKVRKLVWDCLSLINDIEKLPDLIETN